MATPLADSITIGDFRDILERYPALIKTIAKPPKEGKTSLEDLDKFRYIDAPSRLSIKTGAKQIELPDIQKLVDWKIRHGKFRPTLPKLVASNPEGKAQEVTEKAFASYATKSDVKTALATIAELKGIGPATASLILAVHDPENIMFFSDEAYHWLCVPNNEAAPDLKYNAKEYDALYAKAKALMARLKVSPIDIEKVAYVLKKEDVPMIMTKNPTGKAKGRSSFSEESKMAGAVASRPRGRPKTIPKPEVDEDLEEVDEAPAPAIRPKGVPKPKDSASNKPGRVTTKEPSPAASEPVTRRSKRNAGEDVRDADKPAPKRGRPKGKTG